MYVTAQGNGKATAYSISSASTCNCSGDDLHYHANYPSQHYHYRPKDVRILRNTITLTDTKPVNVARNVPQPADRESAWSRRATNAARPCQRGDRVDGPTSGFGA